MRKLANLAAVLGLFCLAPFHDVRADPALLTSGSFVVQGPGALAPFAFSMSGPDISFEGGGASIFNNIGPVVSCLTPCRAVALFSIASGGDIDVRDVTHNGVSIPRLTAQVGSLFLQFNAPTVAIPPEFLSASGVVLIQPFTLTGSLMINRPTMPDVHPLSGIGFVEVQLNRATFPGLGPGFVFRRASYNVVSTPAELPPAGIQTIAEPTTVVLFGTGLAGLGAAIRKRRRKSRQ